MASAAGGPIHGASASAAPRKNSAACKRRAGAESCFCESKKFIKGNGAEEGTRTPTPLRAHGPEPCASANSATSAKVTGMRRALPIAFQEGLRVIFYRGIAGRQTRDVGRNDVGKFFPRFRVSRSQHLSESLQSRRLLLFKPEESRTMAPKTATENSRKLPDDDPGRLRMLAHDLSNSLETILQAA